MQTLTSHVQPAEIDKICWPRELCSRSGIQLLIPIHPVEIGSRIVHPFDTIIPTYTAVLMLPYALKEPILIPTCMSTSIKFASWPKQIII